MQRREFITLLAGALVIWPLTARAQHVPKVRRIGYLSGGTETAQRPLLAAFRRGMQELGYVEGSDFSIDALYSEGKFERLPLLAKELLSRNPDVLFVQSTPGNLAAKRITQSIPIVMNLESRAISIDGDDRGGCSECPASIS